MGDSPKTKDNLIQSMTFAAFVGVSWYVGAEMNISLFWSFKLVSKGSSTPSDCSVNNKGRSFEQLSDSLTEINLLYSGSSPKP